MRMKESSGGEGSPIEVPGVSYADAGQYLTRRGLTNGARVR